MGDDNVIVHVHNNIKENKRVDEVVVDSSMFLKKLEDQAMHNIIAAVKSLSNDFQCTVIVDYDVMTDTYRVMVVYSINGKQCRVDHRTENNYIDMSKLIFEVAKDIAVNILSPAIGETFKNNPNLSKIMR